jgi:hypothetical protein
VIERPGDRAWERIEPPSAPSVATNFFLLKDKLGVNSPYKEAFMETNRCSSLGQPFLLRE